LCFDLFFKNKLFEKNHELIKIYNNFKDTGDLVSKTIILENNFFETSLFTIHFLELS